MGSWSCRTQTDSAHRWTRRDFLSRTSSVIGASLAVPYLTGALHAQVPDEALPNDPDRQRILIQQGLDTLRSLGVTYGDVRLTYARRRRIVGYDIEDRESMTVGVRALVDGYWGFTASPIWNADEMTRLARAAVAQAKVGKGTRARRVELAPRPVIRNGSWETPLDQDPFTVHPVEIMDMLGGLQVYTKRRYGKDGFEAKFLTVLLNEHRQSFGATDDSFLTQRIVSSSGSGVLLFDSPQERANDGLELAPAETTGWGRFQTDMLRNNIDRAVEGLLEWIRLPWVPADVGKSALVCCADSTAQLVNQTIGVASELDRAIGFEANAGGTSYLNEPQRMAGQWRLGTPLLTVKANRSAPGALATVRWDDEGVEPREIEIIRDGVFQNYQTNRESTGWLDSYGLRAESSSGGAFAPTAWDIPLIHSANLGMSVPDTRDDFDSLIASMGTGIATEKTSAKLDMMQLNGLATAMRTYQIRHGKKVARIGGAGFLFKSSQLWNTLAQIGGHSSVRRVSSNSYKGEPPRSSQHSVTAVPALFTDVSVIDVMRRA